ncbi:hypothetical protein J6590_075844 [Homalodisca vitripennis]|nr:hypothetical protein J6590_075844 [Homalodisca vitripennis]
MPGHRGFSAHIQHFSRSFHLMSRPLLYILTLFHFYASDSKSSILVTEAEMYPQFTFLYDKDQAYSQKLAPESVTLKSVVPKPIDSPFNTNTRHLRLERCADTAHLYGCPDITDISSLAKTGRMKRPK